MPRVEDVVERINRAFPPTRDETTVVQVWNAFFGSGDGNTILQEEMGKRVAVVGSRTWRLNQAATVTAFAEVIASVDGTPSKDVKQSFVEPVDRTQPFMDWLDRFGGKKTAGRQQGSESRSDQLTKAAKVRPEGQAEASPS